MNVFTKNSNLIYILYFSFLVGRWVLESVIFSYEFKLKIMYI